MYGMHVTYLFSKCNPLDNDPIRTDRQRDVDALDKVLAVDASLVYTTVYRSRILHLIRTWIHSHSHRRTCCSLFSNQSDTVICQWWHIRLFLEHRLFHLRKYMPEMNLHCLSYTQSKLFEMDSIKFGSITLMHTHTFWAFGQQKISI